MSDVIELFKDPPMSTASSRLVSQPGLTSRSSDARSPRWTTSVGGAILPPPRSQRWYADSGWMIAVCIDEMKKRGMEAWLYDEDDWPSGTMGGRLTQPHPEYRMRYLRVQEMRINGGVTYQTRLQQDDNTLLGVQAWAYEETAEGMRLLGDPQDITEYCGEGKLQWHAPLGKWLIAVLWECPVAERVTWDRGYYLDTMNPEAVNAFKAMAYEPYLRFKEDFGTTVKGIFTDEPGLMIHDGFFGVEAMRTTVEDPQGTLPGVIIAWTRPPRAPLRLRATTYRASFSMCYAALPRPEVRADYYDAW